MLTLWCIVVVIGSLWFIGLPVAKVLSEPEDDNETLWITAPFIGLAVIILVLQNLVYLDVPICHSTVWLWVGTCLLWGWLVKSKRLDLVFQTLPRLLFISALGVYLIQGLGLLIVGAKYYVGRGWHDQFNGTALSQFLVDIPFSFSFDEVARSPYLLQALCRKLDRIGPLLYQGFAAVSAFTDAKTMFEPVILLSPLLTVLAVYWLGRRLSLSRWSILPAAVASGILPGIAMVHLESFFSQALAIPLLLVWPVFLSEAIDRLSGRWLLASSLILAAVTSIYTEFYVILLGTGTLVMGISALRRPKEALFKIGLWAVLIWTALLMNPGFVRAIGNVLKRISAPGVLSGIYPWAFSIEGLTRLWIGDLGAGLAGYWPQIFGVISVGLLITAYIGIGFTLVKRKDGLTLGIAALVMLPVIVRFKGSQYSYQFYKLLLSISPLMPLGVAVFLKRLGKPHRTYESFLSFVRPTAVFILIALSCVSTGDMALRSGLGHTMEEIGRGGAHKLLTPSTRAVQDVLSSMHDKDLYILYNDGFHGGGFINAWLTYFARHNRVWVANPLISDISLDQMPGVKRSPFKPIDDPFLLTTTHVESFKDYLVWSSRPYYLYEFPLREWIALSEFINPRLDAFLEGFGPYDFMGLSFDISGDGNRDTVIRQRLHASGKIKSIEVRSSSEGPLSVWDTIPGNHWIPLGVAEMSRPDVLMNRRDGSVDIDVRKSRTFFLYLQDNGTIASGRQSFQVTVIFTDGRVAKTPVKRTK